MDTLNMLALVVGVLAAVLVGGVIIASLVDLDYRVRQRAALLVRAGFTHERASAIVIFEDQQ